MKQAHFLTALLFSAVLLVQSCIVTGPKYSHVEQVVQLQPGMTLDEVNAKLGLNPYDIHCYDSLGNRSYIYKYRTTDRRTFPLLLKETNGFRANGKYMDLVAYYDSTNVSYRFESRTTDSKLDQKQLNFNTLITVITVTAPAVLVYLGITKE